MAGGPAEFRCLGEGRVCRLEIIGSPVGLRQAQGSEGTGVQVVLGQEREGPPGMLDGALRIPLETSVQRSDSSSGCQQMLRVDLVRARPRLLALTFPGADHTLCFLQEGFDTVQSADQYQRRSVPDQKQRSAEH